MTTLFIPLPLCFAALIPPQITYVHPFPHFGSSLKHPVNHVQSQNALPMHPVGVMSFCWDSPGRCRDRVFVPPESAI